MRRFLPFFLLLAALGFLAFAVLVYHSDYTVRARFVTARWVAPAQVFSAPLELHAGAPLSAEQLAAALRRLGYREVGSGLDRAGEFRRAGNEVRLVRRAFAIGDQQEPPRALIVSHRGQQIRPGRAKP